MKRGQTGIAIAVMALVLAGVLANVAPMRA